MNKKFTSLIAAASLGFSPARSFAQGSPVDFKTLDKRIGTNVFDNVLAETLLKFSKLLQTTQPSDREISKEAFRILIDAERFKRNSDADSWKGIEGDVLTLLNAAEKAATTNATQLEIERYTEKLGFISGLKK